MDKSKALESATKLSEAIGYASGVLQAVAQACEPNDDEIEIDIPEAAELAREANKADEMLAAALKPFFEQAIQQIEGKANEDS